MFIEYITYNQYKVFGICFQAFFRGILPWKSKLTVVVPHLDWLYINGLICMTRAAEIND
jgi:hypothetical protein